jgi:hypothetical protein
MVSAGKSPDCGSRPEKISRPQGKNLDRGIESIHHADGLSDGVAPAVVKGNLAPAVPRYCPERRDLLLWESCYRI